MALYRPNLPHLGNESKAHTEGEDAHWFGVVLGKDTEYIVSVLWEDSQNDGTPEYTFLDQTDAGYLLSLSKVNTVIWHHFPYIPPSHFPWRRLS